MFAHAQIPYCGLPVDPQALLEHWNLDPILLCCLGLLLATYAAGAKPLPRGAKITFASGWLLGALALTSPLCPLSVSLFSARIGQHLILTAFAAPLMAAGLPHLPLRWSRPLPAAAVFAVAMWFWEAPGPYAATFGSDAVYWMMHISMTISAVWLWAALMAGAAPGALLAALFSMMQMSLLGALLTFAPRALYAWHLTTTAPYGVSPLEDQQLGGLLMWVPGAGPFFIVALVVAARLLSPMRTARPA